MDEYYVNHFYQVKPTIKILFNKKIIFNMYIILYVIYLISYKHMIYDIIFIIYFYVKNIGF